MNRLKLNIQLFGASGSASSTVTSTAGNKATINISFNENSVDKGRNTSNVTINGSITMNTGSYSQVSSPMLYIYWHDDKENYDRLVASKNIKSLSRNQTESVSGTIDVEHKNDGKLNGYAIVTWSYTGTSSYVPKSGTATTSNTALTNIPRESTISSTNANVGANPTITITPKATGTGYTHTVDYWFSDSVKGTVVTKTSSTSINTWAIPTSVYNLIPNSSEMIGTLTCTTYNGNEIVGTPTTCQIKALVPNTVKPTVSDPTKSDDNTITSAMGIYVAGKSKIRFTFTDKASSTNGSYISYYVLKFNNEQVYSGLDNSYTLPENKLLATNTYEFIAYDARGNFQTTGSLSLTSTTYSSPVCTIKAERNATTQTTVDISYSFTINTLNNKNAKSVSIQYKEANTSNDWTNILTNKTDYTKTGTTNKTELSKDKSYSFRIVATDSFGQSPAVISEVGTTETLLNFNSNGKTMAFGKVSEKEDEFEFAKPIDTVELKVNGTNVFLKAYPVGSIYMSTSSTSPASLFGGTWEQIAKGRTLMGEGVVEANNDDWCGTTNAGDWTAYAGGMGGETFHTLTVEQMPSHNHTMDNYNPGGSTTSSLPLQFGSTKNGYGYNLWTYHTGGGKSHNNMPPYLVVYMWKRTA